MKKPTFIITEVLLSLCLVASAATVGLVAYDLKTNNIGLDKYNPFSTSENSKTESSATDSTSSDNSKSDNSKSENSKKEISDTSKQESSKAENSNTENSSQESSTSENSTSESSQSGENSSSSAPEVTFRSEPSDLSEQPDELVSNLKSYNYDINYNIAGDRLIMVVPDGTKAKVYCYAKSSSGTWWNVIGDGQPITENAYVGENGTAFSISEGSKKTPGGIFFMGDAFYTGSKPDSTYSMFEITNDSYWVTDSKSELYNQYTDTTEGKDWENAIHMIDNSGYKYGITIHYNDKKSSGPIQSDAGSAIFLQCGDKPTSGGIAVPGNVMKSIIEWLNDTNLASIFILV